MLETGYQIQEDSDYDLNSVEEGNKLQKRMANFKQHLGQKLEDMGLEISFEPPKNHDPQLAVQHQIEQLTSLLIEKTEQVIQDHLNLTQLVTRNQSTILKYFAGVLSMAEVMIVFSKDLYSSGEHISTFRNFKKLYDEFSEYSVLLNGYHAFTQQFEDTKRKFMGKQEVLLNKIIFKDEQTEPQSERQDIESQLTLLREQNQELLGVLRKYEQELSKYEPLEGYDPNQVHKQNLKLMGELDKLQRILNQNNQDFAIQVQRYNRLLFDQRQDFKRIEMDLRNDIRVLEYSIRQAEKQLGMLKEQKYKDQIMIENLIRKNRHLEKRDSFQISSPSHKLNHTTAIIPTSPKRLGMHSTVYSKKL